MTDQRLVAFFLVLILLPVWLPSTGTVWLNVVIAMAGTLWVMAWFKAGHAGVTDRAVVARRGGMILWGWTEWLLTVLFVLAQLLFLREPLGQGRDYQGDLGVAAVNAARWGSAWLPAPGFIFGWLGVLGSVTMVGWLVSRRARPLPLFVAGSGLVITAVGNLLLFYQFSPLLYGATPAWPAAVETLWLALVGINETAVYLAAMLFTVGTAILLHRLVWSAFGQRLGAVSVVALCYFNPVFFHYAHTGIRFSGLMFFSVLTMYALYQYLQTGRGRGVAWLSLACLLLWHPLAIWCIPVFCLATLPAEGRVSRWQRCTLLATAGTAATGLYAWQIWWRGAAFLSWQFDPAFWEMPQRLLFPWLALPLLLTYLLTFLLLATVFIMGARLHWPAALGLAVFLLTAVALFHGVGTSTPLYLVYILRALFIVSGCTALVLLTWTMAGGVERMAMAWLLLFPVAVTLSMAYDRVELWLTCLPGALILLGRTFSLLRLVRCPLWLPPCVLALLLLTFCLVAGESEWTNLITREWYRLPWPQAVTALRSLPAGAGIYCPVPDTPLEFYLAQQGLHSRFRLGRRPWTVPERQTLDTLYTYCRVRNYHALLVPRHYLVGEENLEYRKTPLSMLAESLQQGNQVLASPGGRALGGYVAPGLVEQLLVAPDPRFVFRGIYRRGKLQIVLFEIATLLGRGSAPR